MTIADIRAALAEYDPEIEWDLCDCGFSLCHEGDPVHWMISDDQIMRSEGCYEQACDYLPPHSVADVMNAMDAAAKALNDYLRSKAP